MKNAPGEQTEGSGCAGKRDGTVRRTEWPLERLGRRADDGQRGALPRVAPHEAAGGRRLRLGHDAGVLVEERAARRQHGHHPLGRRHAPTDATCARKCKERVKKFKWPRSP